MTGPMIALPKSDLASALARTSGPSPPAVHGSALMQANGGHKRPGLGRHGPVFGLHNGQDFFLGAAAGRQAYGRQSPTHRVARHDGGIMKTSDFGHVMTAG